MCIQDYEKIIKRYLKKKIGFSLAIIISFLITGEITYGFGEYKNKEKNTQFFFNLFLNRREANKMRFGDYLFKDDGEPDFYIPDIVSPIIPTIPEDISPFPNNSHIINEPSYEFGNVTDFEIKEPNDLNISIVTPTLPSRDLSSDKFNTISNSDIYTPASEVNFSINLSDVVSVNENIKGNIVKPTLSPSYSPVELYIPDINISDKPVTATDISITPVQVSGSGFNQGAIKSTIRGASSSFRDVLTNFKSYDTTTSNRASTTPFKVTFDTNNLTYSGNGIRLNESSTFSNNFRSYYNNSNVGAAFISNTMDDDSIIKGDYEIYNKSANSSAQTKIFLSVNPAEVGNSLPSGTADSNWEGTPKQKTVAITSFEGNLNLTSDPGILSALVGIEHQTWDKYIDGQSINHRDATGFFESYSVVLNKGTINVGDTNSKKVIGIMIDLEQSSYLDATGKKYNNKTINAGTINVNGQSSIGISFEEYKNSSHIGNGYSIVGREKGFFMLRDDAYLGNINIAGSNNYGFRMGNNFKIEGLSGDEAKHMAEYQIYYDKTKVYGVSKGENLADDGVTINNGSIAVTNDSTNSGSNKTTSYTSKITVSGTENVGMVVAKSLSGNAAGYDGHVDVDGINLYENGNLKVYSKDEIEKWLSAGKVNPIDNYYNVVIEVDGEKTIGFMRASDYSNNNRNDIIINDKNITGLSFGNNAKNSVLIRSEQYGITLDRDLKLMRNSNSYIEDTQDSNNVIMQATAKETSVGVVTNNKNIETDLDDIVAMMASGSATGSNDLGKNESEIINNGSIVLNGNNNIGMAVLGNNIGYINGKIDIFTSDTTSGTKNIGIYNEGKFSIKDSYIHVEGEDAVAVYNNSSQSLQNDDIKFLSSDTNAQNIISIGKGAMGIYAVKGTITKDNSASILITDKDDISSELDGTSIGIYVSGEGKVDFKENVEIDINNGLSAIAASGKGTINLENANISYSGDKYAIYLDGDGEINLKNSILTLDGYAHAYNIDTTNAQSNLKLNGTKIRILSPNVTVFDIVHSKTQDDTTKTYSTATSSTGGTGADEKINSYIGQINVEEGENSLGYKLAAIDGGVITLDNKENEKNIDFLKKYKFQKSQVNVLADITMDNNNNFYNRYFDGQAIGIALSSSSRIDSNVSGEEQRKETQINIGSQDKSINISVNRNEKAEENNYTIGAYINYGELNFINGNIVVENDSSNIENKNSTGIYTKNSSKVVMKEQASILVKGDNGIGIYSEGSSKETIQGDKNSFGGNITPLEVENSGTIHLTGKSGIGIYANNYGSTTKGTIVNNGSVEVGENGSTDNDSAIGIYGINTEISHNGTIKIGSNNVTTNAPVSIGIYAIGSNVNLNSKSSFKLGNSAIGIILNGESTIKFDKTSGEKLVFENLDSISTLATNNIANKIGILSSGRIDKNTIIENSQPDNFNFDIDMSNVDKGTAILTDNRDLELNSTLTISGNGGRGIRVNSSRDKMATIINNGVININPANITSPEASVGLLAVNTYGQIDNKGQINLNSKNSIGIYIDSTESKNNKLLNIGNIDLNSENNIGLLLKNTKFDVVDDSSTSTSKITYGESSKNGVGIYADENTVLNLNKEIDKDLKNGNVLFLATNNSKLINSKNIKIRGGIAVYLNEEGSYETIENGSINVSQGGVGIFVNKGAAPILDFDIQTSGYSGVNTSKDTTYQTIGIALVGDKNEVENRKTQELSGKITLQGGDTGNNLGIYSLATNILLEKNNSLSFKYKDHNSIALYLDNSSLLGEGTVNFIGNLNSTDKSSIGIFYTKSTNASNKANINIEKSNMVGSYISSDANVTRVDGTVKIGEDSSTVNETTGFVISENGIFTNKANINLNNTTNSTAIAVLGGTTNNSGNISINNSSKALGIYLGSDSNFDGTGGKITIKNSTSSSTTENVGVGVYIHGENIKVKNFGNFDLDKGNIAVYSVGSNISTNLDLNKFNNEAITAIAASSENGKTIDIGGTITNKMKLKLSKNSTGIYAMDSNVNIENMDIDGLAGASYGVFLKNNTANNKAYNITNSNISNNRGAGVILESSNIDTGKQSELEFNNNVVSIYTNSINNKNNYGVYVGQNNKASFSNNVFNVYERGVALIGDINSTLNLNSGNTFNLRNNSTAIYSNGNIEVGAGNKVNFSENTSGYFAYSSNGEIKNNTNLIGNNSTMNNFIALASKGDNIENTGKISLSGANVFGIVNFNENGSDIKNSGEISITGVKNNTSVGIFSKGNISNSGNINVNDYSMGIVHQGNADELEQTGKLILNGPRTVGATLLNGSIEKITFKDIISQNISEIVGSCGLYFNNFSSTGVKVDNIQLGANSMGIYYLMKNSTSANQELKIEANNVSVGSGGIAVGLLGNENTLLEFVSPTKISSGELGTSLYVNGGTVKLKSFNNINSGMNGAVAYVNGEDSEIRINTLNDIQALNLDGSIGFILENNGNIVTDDGSTLKRINVKNGGTGIVVRGSSNLNLDILDGTTINLGSSSKDKTYSIGIYYQEANDKNSLPSLNITYDSGAEYTIGTIFDRTYGDIKNSFINMDNSISNSIGVVVRRTKIENGENDKKVTLSAGENNTLINVTGVSNIGLSAKNSFVETKGDINVGGTHSIGTYLSDSMSDIKCKYIGTGNINVTGASLGIYSKNYDIDHTGDITLSGTDLIGIISINDEERVSSIIQKGNINISGEKAIGIYGKNNNLDISGDRFTVNGDGGIGISSLNKGDILFKYDTLNIGDNNSVGIYKTTENSSENFGSRIELAKGEWNIGANSTGIVGRANSADKIYIENNADMNLKSEAIGIYSYGVNEIINTGNIQVGPGKKDSVFEDFSSSVGIYLANGIRDTKGIGVNKGVIYVEESGGIGIQAVGYAEITNSEEGKLYIANNGVGMVATYGATAVNNGEIYVNNGGGAMLALGKNTRLNSPSLALNNGTIILGEEGSENNTDQTSVGMGAFNGGRVVNNGEIIINEGIGMYFDKDSSFMITENGHLTLNNGIGIMGRGVVINKGQITINGGTAIVDKDQDISTGSNLTIENTKGSLVLNKNLDILEVNENFYNLGGSLDSKYNLQLNNPMVDITTGEFNFTAPSISGEIKLDSNFILEGDGVSYTIPKFFNGYDNIKVNTSILYSTNISEDGDLNIIKNPYSTISNNSIFNERDGVLDKILANKEEGSDILKALNYYLNGISDPDVIRSEYSRVAGELTGNIYSNIQTRMQDINKNFKNSFEEMVRAKNYQDENYKYSLINTDGKYRNKRSGVLEYDYNIIGLYLMKEFESFKDKKYGYELGFSNTKFKFKNSLSSEEVYSLRGGLHQVRRYEDYKFLSRVEIGYNNHRADRKFTIMDKVYTGKPMYSSYQLTLDNTLLKTLIKDEKTEISAYSGYNFEYGIYESVIDSKNIDLKVKSNDYLSSKVYVGINSERKKPLNDNYTLILKGDVSYSYNLGDDYGNNKVRIGSGSDYINLDSEEKTRGVITGKASIGIRKNDKMGVALETNIFKDFQRDENNYDVGIRFHYILD